MVGFRTTFVLVATVIALTACGPALPSTFQSASGADQSDAAPAAPTSKAPHPLAAAADAPDFNLMTTRGAAFHLADVLKTTQSVVLVFYPGLYCQSCLDLEQVMEANQVALDRTGAQLVAVARQWPSEAAASTGEPGSRFMLLADSDGTVARQYGLPPLMPGKPKPGSLPITIFIIDGGGKIVCSGPAEVDGRLMLERWLSCMLPPRRE
jgi:peroxiredoxin